MTIKPSVFGSDNERELFKTLESHWLHKFDLWPNIPFTNVIDISNFPLSDREREFIYKTSVDYTLCKKDGKPLLSIEFDGLGHGFSRNGKYIQLVPTPDKYRKLKLDLKLKIADKVEYPFFIVSYDEKEPIGPGVQLTIVDGIIGKVLASKYWKYLIDNLHLDEGLISTLSKVELDNYIDNLAIEAEVEAEIKWNPIKSLAAKYSFQGWKKGLVRRVMHSYPYGPDLMDAVKICGNCTVETPFGEISKEVWVRDISGFGVSAWMLADEIAELLALKEVLDLYGERE